MLRIMKSSFKPNSYEINYRRKLKSYNTITTHFWKIFIEGYHENVKDHNQEPTFQEKLTQVEITYKFEQEYSSVDILTAIFLLLNQFV